MIFKNDLELYFRYRCEKGLEQRGLLHKKEYQNRLQYEIDIISQMGFPGYFLIVWDMINWAKENNIYVGPGRGSCAGSLVAYSLGITNLDPIRWGLLFERFLNPGRAPPDIQTKELSFSSFKKDILPTINIDKDFDIIQ